MVAGNRKSVSISDTKWEKISVVEGAEGYIKLEIQKAGDIQTLQSSWFNFYIEQGRTIIEAFFGEDNGEDNVPAVALWAYRPPLTVGRYEIDRPPEKIAGLFGTGRPSEIGAAAFGKGILIVDETSSELANQYVKGSFEFIYKDYDDVMVKVVAKEFWARKSE